MAVLEDELDNHRSVIQAILAGGMVNPAAVLGGELDSPAAVI
jgi:hypothetical protein